MLPEVVPEDAAVYRMCWRVLSKDVIGKETVSLSNVAYLKTYLVTLGSTVLHSFVINYVHCIFTNSVAYNLVYRQTVYRVNHFLVFLVHVCFHQFFVVK